MTKFIISTYDAEPSFGGGFMMKLHLGGGNPVPDKMVEAKGCDGALAHLSAHIETVKALDKPLAVSIMLARNERAPNGWRKLQNERRKTTVPVNVPGCD